MPVLGRPWIEISIAAGRKGGHADFSLVWASLVASLAFGPLGAVAAIVFGWVAVHESAEDDERLRRVSVMASLAIALGVLMTVCWGAAIALGVWSGGRREASLAEATSALETVPSEAPVAHLGPPLSPPETAAEAGAGVPIQKETTAREEGVVTVVDVGAVVTSLVDELAKQRAEAALRGETVLVMTTRAGCSSCQVISASLSEPLMQTALAGVRLVRVDVDAFADDLDALRIQHERLPGFFLLALDLSPRDAIDGGEWDEDVAANVAPPLGAFVRGKYRVRRQAFHPVP